MTWPGESQRHSMSAKGVKTVETDLRFIEGKKTFEKGTPTYRWLNSLDEEKWQEFLDRMARYGTTVEYDMHNDTFVVKNVTGQLRRPDSSFTLSDVHKLSPQMVKSFVEHWSDDTLTDWGMNERVKNELYERYNNIVKTEALDDRPDNVYALFSSSVRPEDKYHVTTAPAIFFGSEVEAREYMEERGWTDEDTKIMVYNREIADKIMKRKKTARGKPRS